MRIVQGSIIPSPEVLTQCRTGLTKHIRKTRTVLKETHDRDLKKHFSDKLHKLKIIRDEIQFLIDAL